MTATSIIPSSRSTKSQFLEGSSAYDAPLDYLDQLVFSEQVEGRIQALVTTAKHLGLEQLSCIGYSNALINLSSKKLSLKQSLHRTEFAMKELESHLAAVEHEYRLLDRWKSHFDDILYSNPGEGSPELLERRRQALSKKAKEYKREHDSIKLEDTPVTVSDLSAQQARNKETEEKVRQKRAKLKVYQGLPPNLDQARAALKKARTQQMRLIRMREKLLSDMAESVS
ncbi:hypothetical protein V5O48_014329 [Marasmius crinis-equi]|uniref:Uncharacterized protein n=1 Tax=Marasmius crinis-equi TaxID=585013 RepID=A0ABR3EXL5_9AGAR